MVCRSRCCGVCLGEGDHGAAAIPGYLAKDAWGRNASRVSAEGRCVSDSLSTEAGQLHRVVGS